MIRIFLLNPTYWLTLYNGLFVGYLDSTICPLTRAQARQRTGRAGREAPGVCYRLYTEDTFQGLAGAPVPEIRRCNLSSVVLQVPLTILNTPHTLGPRVTQTGRVCVVSEEILPDGNLELSKLYSPLERTDRQELSSKP
eukprot:9501665-Pyramimonas_sp.AAC.3